MRGLYRHAKSVLASESGESAATLSGDSEDCGVMKLVCLSERDGRGEM